MGRVNERIARIQESFTAHATTGWLESLERSLAQMKEYQVCMPTLLRMSPLTYPGCTQEAREPTIGLRRLALEDAEGQEGGLQDRGGAPFTEGKIRRVERRSFPENAGYQGSRGGQRCRSWRVLRCRTRILRPM